MERGEKEKREAIWTWEDDVCRESRWRAPVDFLDVTQPVYATEGAESMELSVDQCS